MITFISPEVIRDIGDSAELNCTVDNPNDFSVLWSKKAKNQDPVPLSIGNHLTVKDRRFNLTSDGKTYTLHVSEKHIVLKQWINYGIDFHLDL